MIASNSRQFKTGVVFMITLRNVLLSTNGLLLLLLLYQLFQADPGLHWLPYATMLYLVTDFVYLSLTFPKRRFSEYLALFRGDLQS
jgi:hypothetical protein